jgi:hypothetical protein
MRKTALLACKKAKLSATQALTVGLKLSVDSTNLDRFTPIQLDENGERFFTNKEASAMFAGEKNDPKTLTVNRFCAALSPEISKYLGRYPDETWGQVQIDGVESKFCFPHAYYIPGLKADERAQVYAFLCEMDLIMSNAIATWRPITIKAAFYWKAIYGDKVKINGRSVEIDFKPDN